VLGRRRRLFVLTNASRLVFSRRPGANPCQSAFQSLRPLGAATRILAAMVGWNYPDGARPGWAILFPAPAQRLTFSRPSALIGNLGRGDGWISANGPLSLAAGWFRSESARSPFSFFPSAHPPPLADIPIAGPARLAEHALVYSSFRRGRRPASAEPVSTTPGPLAPPMGNGQRSRRYLGPRPRPGRFGENSNREVPGGTPISTRRRSAAAKQAPAFSVRHGRGRRTPSSGRISHPRACPMASRAGDARCAWGAGPPRKELVRIAVRANGNRAGDRNHQDRNGSLHQARGPRAPNARRSRPRGRRFFKFHRTLSMIAFRPTVDSRVSSSDSVSLETTILPRGAVRPQPFFACPTWWRSRGVAEIDPAFPFGSLMRAMQRANRRSTLPEPDSPNDTECPSRPTAECRDRHRLPPFHTVPWPFWKTTLPPVGSCPSLSVRTRWRLVEAHAAPPPPPPDAPVWDRGATGRSASFVLGPFWRVCVGPPTREFCPRPHPSTSSAPKPPADEQSRPRRLGAIMAEDHAPKSVG